MPKVNYLRPTNEDVIVSNIVRYMQLHHIDKKDLRFITGSMATLYRRFNNPGQFTIEELNKIARKLQVKVSDLLVVGEEKI